MKKSITLLFTFLSALVWAQPAFVADSLDKYIEREMKRWNVPGLAIAIVKDGKVVIEKGYGVKEAGKPGKVNEYTQFQIASNSKAFTGTALAWLHYDKKLSLDDKVTKHMPWFGMYDVTSTQLCTVRDLLCHRLGTQTFQGDFLNWGSNLTRKEIIEHFKLTPPMHPFRYKYGYSNVGFITAGEIIPIVTDTSWDDFLRYRFFNPLGMKHTNTSYQLMKNDTNSCTPHTIIENKLITIPLANIENMGASAAINSCVADMKNWVLLQLDNGKFNGQQLIPTSAVLEARKSHMISSDVNSKVFKSKHFSNYGLGWSSYDYEGRRVFEHSGGANGFVTKTEFIPEENVGVIVYTNTDANSLYDALCKQVLEAYLNVPYRNLSEVYYNNGAKNREVDANQLKAIKDSIQKRTPTPIDLKNYCGVYKNEFYGKVEIKLIKGKLQLFFQHHPNNIGTVEHIAENRFWCTYSDKVCGAEPLYVKMENNSIKSVTIKVNDFIDYISYEFVKEP